MSALWLSFASTPGAEWSRSTSFDSCDSHGEYCQRFPAAYALVVGGFYAILFI